MIYFSLTPAGYAFLAAEALAAQVDFAAVFHGVPMGQAIVIPSL
jgi:hypothetical protein